MADNIANILPPSSVRLTVEPVEVELERADGSMLFSALQSAFPQCTGIYFRPRGGAQCRTMLKFDGRRFLPPNGGWSSGIDYFVELGGGSRHTPFPFGSYELASKQFERSVNLVQQMMNGSLNKKSSRTNSGPKSIRGEELNDSLPQMFPTNGGNDIGVVQQHMDEPNVLEHQQEANEQQMMYKKMDRKSSGEVPRELKSLERDFADLARICAGKDVVIDGQRTELDGARKEVDRLRAEQAEWAEKEAEWKAKWETAQRELEMLRELGRDQEGLHGQIVEMDRLLEAERLGGERQRSQLELELKKWQREAQEWKEKSELGTWTTNELTDQLKKVQRERADLQRKAAILEEQVNGEAMEFGRRFQERERIQQELLADNTRLYQIKDQLEMQCRELKEHLAHADGQCVKKVDSLRAEYEAKEEKLRENLLNADSKSAQLEAVAKELAKAKADAEEQIRRLKNHSELGNNGEPLFSYSQQ